MNSMAKPTPRSKAGPRAVQGPSRPHRTNPQRRITALENQLAKRWRFDVLVSAVGFLAGLMVAIAVALPPLFWEHTDCLLQGWAL